MGDLFPLSDYMIRVLAMVGTWVAGLASFAAVVTALCLARRTEKLQLQVRVHTWGRTERMPPLYGTFVRFDYWRYCIVNTSFRPVTVERVGWVWREKFRRKRRWERVAKELPRKLEPGDHIQIDALHTDKMVRLLRSRKPVRTMVETAMGRKTVPVNPSLRKYLRGVRLGNRKAIPNPSDNETPAQHGTMETDPPGDPTA